MSKIKNALKIASISALTFVGADKVLAQDSTNAVPDTSKNKIEMTQAITQPDTARVDTIRTKEFYSADGDGNIYNPWTIKIRTKEVDGKIVSSDTSTEISPFDSTYIYPWGLDSLRQVDEVKANLGGNFLDSAQVDTLRDTRKFSPKRAKKTKSDSVKAKRNYLETGNAFIYDGDGIILGDFLHIFPITPETNMGLDELIHANTGDILYDVINAKKGTRNILKYLRSSDAKKHFGEEGVRVRKARYIAKLDSIKKANTLADSAYDESAQLLGKALENKVISPSDSLFDENRRCKVQEGIYMLLPKNKKESESNPIYVIVQNNTVFSIKNIASFLVGKNMNNYDSTGVDSTKDGSTKIELTNIAPAKTDSISQATTFVNIKKNKKSNLSLIFGGDVGQVNGVDLGVQVGSVAFVGNYSVAGNKPLKSIDGPALYTTANVGMTGTVRTDKTNYKGIGGALEYHFANGFYFGAGPTFWSYDNTRNAIIQRTDGTAKRKSDSEKQSGVSGKGYIGYEPKISEKIKARIGVGIDSMRGLFGMLGLNINLRR